MLVIPQLGHRALHLTFIEKPLLSFLALFAARFSIRVLSGFFFSCFFVSLPLLIFVTPYDWLGKAWRKTTPNPSIFAASSAPTTLLLTTAVLRLFLRCHSCLSSCPRRHYCASLPMSEIRSLTPLLFQLSPHLAMKNSKQMDNSAFE